MSDVDQSAQSDGQQEVKPPWHRVLPERQDVYKGELAERGDWVVAYVQTDAPWPINVQKVTWRDQIFWVIPLMKDAYPAIATRASKGADRARCAELLMRFLSVLSWVEVRGFGVEGIGGGSSPFPMGRNKNSGFVICDEFNLSYLPAPAHKDAPLALALMREGRSLNHAAYAFLSFFRVLEVIFPPQKRKEWLETNVRNVTDHRAKTALDEITKNGITDVAAHLFESGRCAVAHANREPIVAPDNPADMRRLSSELPLMMGLAKKAIEDELGIETSQTVYRKHLYELAGFKEILGPEIVAHVSRGEPLPVERRVDIPDISVRIRRKQTYEPLNGLKIQDLGQDGHRLFMRYASKEGDIHFRFALNFQEERLEFSLFRDIGATDDGSALSAERIAEVRRFENDYFLNGELQIVDADTGKLIARKDAYIPVNMRFDKRAADAEINRWKALAQQRRERDHRFSEDMNANARGYEINVGE
jgi:hypothetical protein